MVHQSMEPVPMSVCPDHHKIYRCYIAPCAQFPYIDLAQASMSRPRRLGDG